MSFHIVYSSISYSFFCKNVVQRYFYFFNSDKSFTFVDAVELIFGGIAQLVRAHDS